MPRLCQAAECAERLRSLFQDTYFMRGADGKAAGFFFVYDEHGNVLLLPPSPKLVGTRAVVKRQTAARVQLERELHDASAQLMTISEALAGIAGTAQTQAEAASTGARQASSGMAGIATAAEEMTRAVSDAARGVDEMARSIASVAGAAREVNTHASTTRSSANSLGALARNLAS